MRQEQLRAVLGYLHRVANPDSGGPGDAQLLDRWRNQRDSAAFEVLVWRHGAMVWNVCRRLLSRQQDIEDAFQATFLTFLRKAESIGRGQFLGSWLYKVAYRTALRARTASSRHTVFEQLDADLLEAAATEEDSWDELAPVLDEEVNRLPEKYRRPFVLCYLEGKTTDEAARDLGCPRGTVGTRLAWARERLRTRLTQRGLALSATGLATLLTAKAAAASLPAVQVASAVKVATLSAAGNALTAGVISTQAAALAREVMQAMFVTKLKTLAMGLFVACILGGGAGLLTHRALAVRTEPTQTAEGKQPTAPAQEGVPPNRETRDRTDEENPIVAEADNTPAEPDKASKEFGAPKITGTVVRVDRDSNSLGLEIRPKIKGEASRTVEIKITDKTELVFSNVGPNEDKLTEGYGADVWLEKDSADVAARVQLRGPRNNKKAFQLTGAVVAVAAGGKGITLERPAKGEPGEQIAIQLTDQVPVTFSNVARDGARMTVGYQGLVRLDNTSQNSAKSVTFFGTAEGKPAKGKPEQADRSGRIVGVSSKGKVLTVELASTKGAEPATIDIKLTDTTQESYHGVAADGAKPVEGYFVHVWLAEGSQDTAAWVRYSRLDPRKSLDARILAVPADGDRFTVELSPKFLGGDPARLEIRITPQTTLVFSNVGLGGARLTAGYHVRGWLVPGSEDTADELLVSQPALTASK